MQLCGVIIIISAASICRTHSRTRGAFFVIGGSFLWTRVLPILFSNALLMFLCFRVGVTLTIQRMLREEALIEYVNGKDTSFLFEKQIQAT